MILTDIIHVLDRECPEVGIYVDNVEQGLTPPAFLLNLIELNLQRELMNRFWYDALFSLVYIPPSTPGDRAFALETIQDRLVFPLEELIGADGKRTYGDIQVRKIDDCLHFTLNYRIRVRRPLEKDALMARLVEDLKTRRETWQE